VGLLLRTTEFTQLRPPPAKYGMYRADRHELQICSSYKSIRVQLTIKHISIHLQHVRRDFHISGFACAVYESCIDLDRANIPLVCIAIHRPITMDLVRQQSPLQTQNNATHRSVHHTRTHANKTKKSNNSPLLV
jgi:hypothetical protein